MSQPQTTTASRTHAKSRTHRLTVTAMLSTVALVLMTLDFSVPLIPAFVKMDVSELPALLAAFSLGPWYGVAVCFIKNALHLLQTSTGGVGEAANFMMGAVFVGTAGIVYQYFGRHKSRMGALIGSLIGAVAMALVSVPLNYYFTYPVYAKFMPIDVILSMYQAIRPSVNGLLECLITFNMPFTFLKGILTVALCFLIYKPLSPLLHK